MPTKSEQLRGEREKALAAIESATAKKRELTAGIAARNKEMLKGAKKYTPEARAKDQGEVDRVNLEIEETLEKIRILDETIPEVEREELEARLEEFGPTLEALKQTALDKYEEYSFHFSSMIRAALEIKEIRKEFSRIEGAKNAAAETLQGRVIQLQPPSEFPIKAVNIDARIKTVNAVLPPDQRITWPGFQHFVRRDENRDQTAPENLVKQRMRATAKG